MFLDASAIASMLLNEDDAPVLKERLNAAHGPYFVSPVAVMETVMAVAKGQKKNKNDPVTPAMIQEAQSLISKFLSRLSVKEIPIDRKIGHLAQEALLAYGKMVRHPAELNLGDCFAYACAKAYRVPLLYKGNDFSQTDLA